MKRVELLQYFTKDELRGRLVGSSYNPDDPDLDIDMSMVINSLKYANYITHEVQRKWFEHIAHEYDKKECGCIKLWTNLAV